MTEEQRYQTLEQEKQNALANSNKTYEDLLNQNAQYSQGVKDYLNQYQQTQNDIYDKQTQFQVDLQNQNKEKAEKEYQQEAVASKNAYYDFINPYGIQAEIQAKNGLRGTGYSETTKSQAWTTQQNRTAQARASMNEAKLQFDNAIKEAYLNNDVNKANLALQILQQQQEEALRNFNYISDTKQNQLSNNQTLDSDYYNRYNTLYSQIQQEKATAEAIRQWEAEMAEQQRQYNESLALQREQMAQEQARWEKEYALSKATAYNNSRSSNYGSLTNGNSGSLTNTSTNGNSYPYGASGSLLGLLSAAGTQQIKTDYYSGNINSDVQYGTFGTKDKNGVAYQPNNIGGQPLSSTGKTVAKMTGYTGNKNSSGVNVDNQKVWQLSDGSTWIWNGSKNKYEQVRFE